MMQKLVFILLFLSHATLAQKVLMRGVLQDTTLAPLPSATILLLSVKDSTLVNFSSTDKSGNFEIRNVARGNYLFKVSYVGFQTYTRIVDLNHTEEIFEMGSVQLLVETRTLNEVTITSEKAPVVIKRDTIEFNASSFKTKENALVEDLLKKLPGIEVDNDGTIRSQGEQVKRVTVDGKNFFGTDPKVATRNLPADAISKVQVFDKKSDQAAFTGIDDGQKEKTINLELKEEKRKGFFGNIAAGAGPDGRYMGRANINRFRKESQFSVLGMANNINEQGFGMEEYMNFTGGSQQMMSGGSFRIEMGSDNQNGIPLSIGGRNNGLMSNYAGGINFNRELSKKTEVTSSYFYNHLNHTTETDLERINYVKDGNLYFNQQSRQQNANDNHRLNTTLEHKIDSLNAIKVTANYTYNETRMQEISTSELISEVGVGLNSTERSSMTEGTTSSLNSSFLWRRRFLKKGRTLTANLQFAFSSTLRNGSLNANVTDEATQSSTEINQLNQQNVETLTYSGTVTYTEPLGNRKYLEGNYSFRENRNDVNRDVYDLESGETVLNKTFSNAYTSTYDYHRAGLNLRVNRSRYTLTAGTAFQNTSLLGELFLMNETIARNFQNILPSVRFNFDFTSTKRARVDYETQVQEPTIRQLQPVVDNNDPVNLYQGNPELRPAYVQNIQVNYSSFNPGSFVHFFSFLDAAYTRNAITVAQNFLPNGVRISRPVNVDEGKRVYANASVGFPINAIKSRINLTGSLRYDQGITIINDRENYTVQNIIGGRIRYEFRYKEVVDISLGANISEQIVNYDQQEDQRFSNTTFSTEVNVSIAKNYQLNSNLDYETYHNRTISYRQQIPLLNVSVSRFLLKAKSGELKLSMNNLLDQNLGISQSATLNYFERQRINSLGRYFLVSFIYSLNKQLNPLGARPRGGMIRIMR